MKRSKIIGIAITLILSFWAADLIWMQGRQLVASRQPLDMIISQLLLVFNDPLQLSLDRNDLLAGLGGAGAVALGWMYAWANHKNYREGEEYGSAQWGGEADMAPYCDRKPEENLQMTQTEAISLDVNATHRNLNTTVVGGSGTGKTRGYVMPNLMKMNMNYAVTDPKGEIYRASAQQMRSHGYTVHKLDLVDMASSDQFNPMRYIDPDTAEQSIMRLSESLIANTDNTKAQVGDQFWTKAEQALYNGLLTYIYYTSDNPCLPQMVDMVGVMQASEENENAMSRVDAQMAAARDMIQEVHDHYDEWDDQVHAIVDGLSFATSQYRTFEQGAGETKKSIIISAGVRLAPMQVPQIRRLLGGDNGMDTIGLDDFCDDGRCILYLVLPDTNRTFNFLAALLYQMLFEHTIYEADHNGVGHLPVPLHFLMDEFANIGQIPNFETLIGTIRGRWISVSIILQAVSQLKTKYKDSWETIVGNCDNILFLGAGKGDETTPKWLSGLLGKQTIDMRESSESKGSHGSFTVNYRRAGRELLTADEIGLLDDRQCIYLLRGVRPFMSRKTDPDRPIATPRSRLKHSPGWQPLSQAGIGSRQRRRILRRRH